MQSLALVINSTRGRYRQDMARVYISLGGCALSIPQWCIFPKSLKCKPHAFEASLRRSFGWKVVRYVWAGHVKLLLGTRLVHRRAQGLEHRWGPGPCCVDPKQVTSYPQAALGYDEGTVVIKLGSEARCYAIYAAKPSTCPCSGRPTAVSQEPVVSMHSG